LRNALLLGLAGLLSAIAIDLDAWRKYPANGDKKPKFDWKTALTRYAFGFLTGFTTGITTMANGG